MKMMPKIKWVGLQKWDRDYPNEPLPAGAVMLQYPDNIFKASIKYGIIPMFICFAALYTKQAIYHEFPLDRSYIIAGIILGLILVPVHEYLHAVCFPKGAIVYVGLSPEKFAAFAVCRFPLSKRRFIWMSMLPVLLGIIPFMLFVAFPISWKIPSALCWPGAMIGILTPMDVHLFAKQVPKGAKICAGSRTGMTTDSEESGNELYIHSSGMADAFLCVGSLRSSGDVFFRNRNEIF
jgi:hypothetical protein